MPLFFTIQTIHEIGHDCRDTKTMHVNHTTSIWKIRTRDKSHSKLTNSQCVLLVSNATSLVDCMASIIFIYRQCKNRMIPCLVLVVYVTRNTKCPELHLRKLGIESIFNKNSIDFVFVIWFNSSLGGVFQLQMIFLDPNRSFSSVSGLFWQDYSAQNPDR